MSKAGKRWIWLLIPLLLLLTCGGVSLWLVSSAKDALLPVRRVTKADQELQRAIKEARQQLPMFEKRLAHPQKGDRFAIRVKFSTPVKEPEYLWLKDPTFDGKGFTATLDENPIAAKLQKGQRLRVSQDDVYDWMVTRADGSTAGGYTEIALRATPQ